MTTRDLRLVRGRASGDMQPLSRANTADSCVILIRALVASVQVSSCLIHRFYLSAILGCSAERCSLFWQGIPVTMARMSLTRFVFAEDLGLCVAYSLSLAANVAMKADICQSATRWAARYPMVHYCPSAYSESCWKQLTYSRRRLDDLAAEHGRTNSSNDRRTLGALESACALPKWYG